MDREWREQNRGHHRRVGIFSSLLTACIVIAVVAVVDSPATVQLRDLFGFGQERLGTPPEVARGEGSFAFMRTQAGTDEPVSYNPCRVIEYAINPEGAPEGYPELVRTAVAHLGSATGFSFDYVGTTGDRNFGKRLAGDPVLVAWADEDEVEDLGGDVAGVGGSTAVEVRPGKMQFVSGIVVLDREVFAQYSANPEGRAVAQSIIDHEFGHLLGLDHVDDPDELMHAQNLGQRSFGPGDREGLARLGAVECFS